MTTRVRSSINNNNNNDNNTDNNNNKEAYFESHSGSTSKQKLVLKTRAINTSFTKYILNTFHSLRAYLLISDGDVPL